MKKIKDKNTVVSTMVEKSTTYSHKLYTYYIQTKLSEEIVDFEIDDLKLLKKMDELEEINGKSIYKNNITFSMFKTSFQDKPSVLMVFKIHNPNNGSAGNLSSLVMNLLESLEKIFLPIDKYHFVRDIDGSKKNISLLKLVKIIDDDENLV